MEIGKQIKQHRTDFGWSQDDLAEKVFVSRQTISNWENGKSYPDIDSLLRISQTFGVTLDQLVKGDIVHMKTAIQKSDIRQFNKIGAWFSVLLILTILSAAPLAIFLDWIGCILWSCLALVTFLLSHIVEKEKKKYDIQTYREIVAFTEGKQLDAIQKEREKAVRPYQKIIFALISALVTVLLNLLLLWLFGAL